MKSITHTLSLAMTIGMVIAGIDEMKQQLDRPPTYAEQDTNPSQPHHRDFRISSSEEKGQTSRHSFRKLWKSLWVGRTGERQKTCSSTTYIGDDCKEAVEEVTSSAASGSSIMDTNIKRFYAIKAFIEHNVSPYGESSPHSNIEETIEKLDVLRSEPPKSQRQLFHEYTATILRCGNLHDVLSYYLPRLELKFSEWRIVHIDIQKYDRDPSLASQFMQELTRYRISSLTSSIFEYLELCDLLIKVFADESLAELEFSAQDILVPLVTPEIFTNLAERPVFRLPTGRSRDVSSIMTEMCSPRVIKALEIKRRHECEEYKALFGRIQDAHKSGAMLSMVDVMLSMFFAFAIKSHLIDLDGYVEYQRLFALPGSPIYMDEAAQADLADDVKAQQALGPTKTLPNENKPQLADLSVARIKELIRRRRPTSLNEKAYKSRVSA